MQRVLSARVDVDGECVGAIGRGLAVLLGVKEGDTEADARYLAEKIVGLRVFPDADGKMNLSAEDAEAAVLVVSQFTLYGDARKGRRPNYGEAAGPETAEALYERCTEMIAAAGRRVATGRFGATMQVSLVNDGPVTLLLDSEKKF